jgi:hypothetical protein
MDAQSYSTALADLRAVRDQIKKARAALAKLEADRGESPSAEHRAHRRPFSGRPSAWSARRPGRWATVLHDHPFDIDISVNVQPWGS